jgi:hypothetical protein
MIVIKNFIDYINSINEGLIETHSGDIVLLDILLSLRRMGLCVNGRFFMDKIYLKIDDFSVIQLNQIEHLFDHIMTFVVNRGGWFPSSMLLENRSGVLKNYKYDFDEIIKNHTDYKCVEIIFESKFDSIVDNIPDKLYHLSIKEYEKKIKKNGLCPRSKSKLSSHLDRIYVCDNLEDCKNLIPQMLFYYTGEKDENVYKLGKKLYKKDITPIIYEIDNSDSFIKKLYNDVNYYNRGYYVLDNISPDKLKIVYSK